MDRFELSRSGREKALLALLIAVVLFLLLGLFRLQVLEHDVLLEQSENNRIRVIPIVPRRGTVTDREGRILIDNRPSYTACIVAAEMVPGVTISNLAEIITMDSSQVASRLKRNMVSRFQPTPIKRDIPFEVVALLEEQGERFPGVTYQVERVRQYVDSFGIEVFTGYVGEVSSNELARSKRMDLRLGSMIGKKGLEKQYDGLLRGREGTGYLEVYASGQIRGDYEGRRWIKAEPGTDLQLTIDLDLQRAAIAAVEGHCCGAVVAMDPRNGEILAMYSFPGYNANIFSSVIPDSLWQSIRDDQNKPLLNRVLSGRYPPGSTTKLVAIGAGLEEGIITEATTFQPCLGGMQFGNRFFRCWNAGGHGRMQVVHTLEQSCDVYMYQLGMKLGVDLLSDYMGKCGFGYSTGVDLPNEASGLNPNSAYYNERYGKGKWSRALVLNNAIGQGEILVTPLQLTRFFCAIANNGLAFRPHIVSKESSSDGDTISIAPTIDFKLPFSSKTLSILNEGLRLVVEGEKGTARALKNNLYRISGKTGTAQNPHGENHALFAGIAPIESPEIVVCAIIENAGDGSEFAAPVVKKIIDVFMKKKYDKNELASTFQK